MQEESKFPKGLIYKINENGIYKVKAKQWGDKVFYNICLTQKKYDGTKLIFYRQLSFYNCEPPENDDYIKIISGFESGYFSSKDPHAWITTLVVTEYEKVENPEVTKNEAISQYNATQSENVIEITPNDLPF